MQGAVSLRRTVKRVVSLDHFGGEGESSGSQVFFNFPLSFIVRRPVYVVWFFRCNTWARGDGEGRSEMLATKLMLPAQIHKMSLGTRGAGY